MRVHYSVLKDNRVYYADPIRYFSMSPDSYIWPDFGPGVDLSRGVDADQAHYLLGMHCQGMCQYVFIYLLIVIEIYLLHVQDLLCLFDLLPEMRRLINHEKIGRASDTGKWIYQIFHFDLLSAIVYLEFASKLVEAIIIIRCVILTTETNFSLDYHLY